MPDIVLTTLNARYWHSSFGLRYLMANMGDLTDRTTMLEFGISERPVDLIDQILKHEPGIVGVGVYIWNIDQATQLVLDLKSVRPEIVVVLGGPEVSYETESQPIVEAADYVVTGEADVAFPQLCHQILDGSSPGPVSLLAPLATDSAMSSRIIAGGVPALADVQLPYDLYTDEDIANRVIYVEVSRGCPFTCEFCLSALDIPVRLFNLDEFLAAMQSLLDRGAKQFKFVDRTFNLNMRVSNAILDFFLERMQPGLFLHFEMIPDRLPDNLKQLIAKFPAGVLQFEIGVQTFNDDVGELISRRQDNEELERNFRFLRQHTGVHIHADLIVGLPGEDIESFARGFDRLVSLEPQEIQIGILKRLKGTPIIRHDEEWKMVYSQHAPFEILSNRLLDFETVHRLRRLSRFWDLVVNSGNFNNTYPLIWNNGSPFKCFMAFSDWLFAVENRSHGVPLAKLAQRIFDYVNDQASLRVEEVALSIWTDYVSGGRRDKPAFLKPFDLPMPHELIPAKPDVEPELPSRQTRHAK